MSIYLAYRPNFDGYYSVFNTFLFFRDIQKANISTRDFINYLCQFISFKDVSQNIYEFAHKAQPKVLTPVILGKGKKAKEPKPKQENLLPSLVKDIIYVPIRFDPETEIEFPYLDHDPENLKNSILIFIGSFPSSLEAIQKLSESFRKVVILDYHWISERFVSTLPQEESYPSNIMHLFNLEKSGATLTLEFFEKLKGSPLLLDPQNQEKLQQILNFIEDKYTKKNMLEDSKHFVSGLIASNTQVDYNPATNPEVFKLLFDIRVSNIIQLGTDYVDEQVERARNLIHRERCVIYLGGRKPNGEGKFGQCYGVKTYERGFQAELFDQLMFASSKDGLQEVGVIFRKVRGSREDSWTMHFRFLRKGNFYRQFTIEYPEAVVTGLYAELPLPFPYLKKWLSKDYFPKSEI